MIKNTDGKIYWDDLTWFLKLGIIGGLIFLITYSLNILMGAFAIGYQVVT